MVKNPLVTILHVHMVANDYTAFLSIMIVSNYMALSAMCKYSTLLTPDVQLENLQPSHKHQGPIAQEPPRRSERIYAKLHPPAPAGPITQSMAKQGAITRISSFTYLEEDNNDKVTGTDPHKFHETSKFRI